MKPLLRVIVLVIIISVLSVPGAALVSAQGGTITVTPSNLYGWIINPRDPAPLTNPTYAFTTVNGGSFFADSGPNDDGGVAVCGDRPNCGGKIYLSRSDYDGLQVWDITSWTYTTYTPTTSAGVYPMYLNLFVDLDGNLATNDIAVMSYSPGDCPGTTLDTLGRAAQYDASPWQTWDALTSAGWANYGASIAGWSGYCNTMPAALSLLASYPNHVIRSATDGIGFIEYGLDIVIGQKTGGTFWDNVEGYLSEVVLNGTTYHFAPDGTTGGSTSSDPELLGSVYWNRDPNDLLVYIDYSTVTLPTAGEIFWRSTPIENAYLVPPAPSGYAYAFAPYYDGFYDVFGMANGVAFGEFEADVQVCYIMPPSGTNAVVGLFDGTSWSLLPTTAQNGLLCGATDRFGQFAVFTGNGAQAAVVDAPAAAPAMTTNSIPVSCALTTTHRVNFRETPNGTVLTRIPYETALTATAQSGDWYNAAYMGQSGWVSAGYVTAVCD